VLGTPIERAANGIDRGAMRLRAAYPDIKSSNALNEDRTDSDVPRRNQPHSTDSSGASQPTSTVVHCDEVLRLLWHRRFCNENERTRAKAAPLCKQSLLDAIAEAEVSKHSWIAAVYGNAVAKIHVQVLALEMAQVCNATREPRRRFKFGNEVGPNSV